MGNKVYEKLERCVAAIRKKTDFVPKLALVLGSGLGGFAGDIEVECVIPYGEIEGFPVSTVSGHSGEFIFGRVEGIPVVCMKGRVHYYEGYEITDVVLPIRVMKLLGAEILFLTNAAGGILKDSGPGDFMLIEDHISLFIPNPLIGTNIDRLGPRFPDMSEVYRKELRDVIEKTAEQCGIRLLKGVYVQCTGPSYETPAEIKLLERLGAGAAGMSTVCEAMAANHMGMKVCGISFISNAAAGISDKPLNHEEVKAAADKAAPKFRQLVRESIINIGRIYST